MKFTKEQLLPILSQWIKWDQDLSAALRDIQPKIMYERLVMGMSYHKLAELYKSTPAQIHGIYHAILHRIEAQLPRPVSELLKEINADLEAQESGKKKPVESVFEFDRIFLN